MMEEMLLETKNLTKKFNEHVAVNNICLHLRKGKIYGLLGRNGSGKTTFMKMILRLMQPTSGEIVMFGERIDGYQKDIYSRVGSIIETHGFYPNLTGKENLEVFARLRGPINHTAIKNALEIAGLPYGDKKVFSKYSLGMKQRLAIANAIMHDPDLLVLDEPTNGLDPIGIAEMRELIKRLSVERGKTILISSHQLAEIEQIVDDIGIIHQGVLVEECDFQQLVKINRKFISLQVSDVNAAISILKEQFGIEQYTVDDKQKIKVFDLTHSTQSINRTLIESGIDVSAIYVNHSSLEDYFKKIIGDDHLD